MQSILSGWGVIKGEECQYVHPTIIRHNTETIVTLGASTGVVAASYAALWVPCALHWALHFDSEKHSSADSCSDGIFVLADSFHNMVTLVRSNFHIIIARCSSSSALSLLSYQ
jgi:hypothetical protein